jgi:saccharopine dehydrogenase-like NADP-dependent oxidoreductase
MRALLLGAGNVGSVVARDLARNGVELLIADRDAARAEALASGLPRAEGASVDVRDEERLASLMRDVDVAVNCTSYRLNLHALRAALKARCHLIDLGGLYYITLKELELDEEARRRGIAALIGMGDDPGTSNMLSRLGAEELKEVEEIRIRWGQRSASQGLAFSFSVGTILDEATMNAVAFRDGRYIELPPLSERELTYFPRPLGRLPTYAVLHSELATLPRFIKGVRHVTYKDSWDRGSMEAVRLFRLAGLLREEAVEVNGARVSPRGLLEALLRPNEPMDTVGALKVEVMGRGEEGRVALTFIVGPHSYSEAYGATVTPFTTALPASVAALMMGRGRIERRGVFPPELLEPELIREILGELGKRGIRIRSFRRRAP